MTTAERRVVAASHVRRAAAPRDGTPWGIRHRAIAKGDDVSVIRMALAFVVIFLVATFPATWFLMLFLGNIGTLVSYWGTLPLGILVSALLGGASASRYDIH
jgi:hypothetical protein